MAVATVDGWDCTGSALHLAPSTGQAAGYITGSGGVPWSTAQQAAHPGFVQIDQTPVITKFNILADFYDLENGAVTVSEIAELVRDGQAAYKAHTRPAQRWPGVYFSRSQVTQVVNALVKGKVTGCPLGIADYDNNHAKAVSEVANASGPYPVVWRQYADTGGGGSWDLDVFSVPWLAKTSSPVKFPPPAPPTLQQGMTGAAVKSLQTALNRAGFGPVAVDGNFGAITEGAVKSYQRNMGLAIDGIVGPATWAKLG